MTLPEVDAITTYGGIKTSLAPPTDPRTDRSAEECTIAYADIAAMTHTVRRCWARVTTAASTGAMVLVDHNAVWGTGTAPTLSRSSAGVFDIQWPTTVSDALSESHTTNLRAAESPQVEGATDYHAQATLTDGRTMRLYVFDMAGVASDAVGTTIFVGAL